MSSIIFRLLSRPMNTRLFAPIERVVNYQRAIFGVGQSGIGVEIFYARFAGTIYRIGVVNPIVYRRDVNHLYSPRRGIAGFG